jgi:hypothetical protein
VSAAAPSTLGNRLSGSLAKRAGQAHRGQGPSAPFFLPGNSTPPPGDFPPRPYGDPKGLAGHHTMALPSRAQEDDVWRFGVHAIVANAGPAEGSAMVWFMVRSRLLPQTHRKILVCAAVG